MSKNFFFLNVKDKDLCEPGTFKTHDIGRKGKKKIKGHARITCIEEGTKEDWFTQAYRLSKKDYKKVGRKLVPTTEHGRKFLEKRRKEGKKIIHIKGDDFKLVDM